MRFALTDEQSDLVATVHTLIAKRAASMDLRAAIGTPEGYDTTLWQTLTEQIRRRGPLGDQRVHGRDQVGLLVGEREPHRSSTSDSRIRARCSAGVPQAPTSVRTFRIHRLRSNSRV